MDSPFGITDWEGAAQDPANRSIGPEDAVFGRLMGALPFVFKRALNRDAVVWMNLIEKGLQPLVQALRGAPKNSLVCRVNVEDFADILVGQPDYVFEVVSHLPESFFTFIKRFLSVNAIDGFATVIRQRLKIVEGGGGVSSRLITLDREHSDDPRGPQNRHRHDGCRRLARITEWDGVTIELNRFFAEQQLRSVIEHPSRPGRGLLFPWGTEVHASPVNGVDLQHRVYHIALRVIQIHHARVPSEQFAGSFGDDSCRLK